ncbi:hypothetical protein [Rheinheimera maricola]|uniref:Uncharacterized protein n=1 Tax=Rheinheimera maricola TaxID=2793282 RepID=A0ABS7XD60_9GAMM|nr:hypothetical protein [Rheinheimera maricola]MBZ9613471.1 hypothetical protein [Rheinheimera maricola]
METFYFKIRKIFIPFLITSALVIVGFYAVVWLSVTKLQLPESFYEDYLLLVSFVLPVAVNVLLFRPRFWILQKSYAGYASNYTLYNIFMFGAIALPMILIGAYFEENNFGFIQLALIFYGVYAGIIVLMLMFSKLHAGYASVVPTTLTSYMASLLQRCQQYRKPAQLPEQVTLAKWKHRNRKSPRKHRGL